MDKVRSFSIKGHKMTRKLDRDLISGLKFEE